VITSDNTRAFVVNRGDGTISMIDAVALQQVGNSLKLPPGAQPFELVVDPFNEYLYVSDQVLPVIYALNINSLSVQYLNIFTIPIGGQDPPKYGLRGLAINRAGDTLLVAAPNQSSLYANPPSTPSYVHAIDVLPGSKTFWKPIGGPIATGNYTYGVADTPNPDIMLVTNFLSDSKGVQVIERQAGQA
jgi:DNA-binding beta-propeller fold protein YncE